jgi:hypothetical protein
MLMRSADCMRSQAKTVSSRGLATQQLIWTDILILSLIWLQVVMIVTLHRVSGNTFRCRRVYRINGGPLERPGRQGLRVGNSAAAEVTFRLIYFSECF